MKNIRYNAIAYERHGPVSDMFVPRKVRISAIIAPVKRLPQFMSALLLLIAAPTLFYQGSTLSFFNDNEQSTGNTFGTGPLGITVTPDHTAAILMLNQAGELFTITTAPIAGSLPLRYKVSGAASGNAIFCAAITANGLAPLAYSGAAGALTTSDTNDFTPWSLTLTLSGTSPPIEDGQICILDLTFEAYQEGGNVGTEYHDTKHVVLTLTADPPLLDVSGETGPPVITTQSTLILPPEEATSTPEANASSTDPAVETSDATTTLPADDVLQKDAPLPPDAGPAEEPAPIVIEDVPSAETPPAEDVTLPVGEETPLPADPPAPPAPDAPVQ